MNLDIHHLWDFNVYEFIRMCCLERSMEKRTNVVLDENLVEAGMEMTGLKSRRALIDYALRELLRRESQKKVLELKGTVHWEDDLSSMRRKREFE
jgi:Arc/MetJ family transcription regulator